MTWKSNINRLYYISFFNYPKKQAQLRLGDTFRPHKVSKSHKATPVQLCNPPRTQHTLKQKYENWLNTLIPPLISITPHPDDLWFDRIAQALLKFLHQRTCSQLEWSGEAVSTRSLVQHLQRNTARYEMTFMKSLHR